MAIVREKAEPAYKYVGDIEKDKHQRRNKALFALMLIVGIIALIGGAVWLFDEFEIDNPSTSGWVGSIIVVVIGVLLIVGGILIIGLGKKHRAQTDSAVLGEKLYLKYEEDAEKEYEHVFSKKKKNKLNALDDFTNIAKVIVLSQHATMIKLVTHDIQKAIFSFEVTLDNGEKVLITILDNKDGNTAFFSYLHHLYRTLNGQVLNLTMD